jgi:hypothetical protein
MRKTMMAAVVASALLATAGANAGNFDGFYVGAGVTSNTADNKITTSTGTSFSMGEGSRQLGFGVNAGYGKTFGQFYLAGEAAYAINQGETGTTVVSGYNYSGKAKSVKSLSILPGFVATKDLLIYARLGKGNVETEENLSNSTASVSASSDIDVITKGVGFEYALNKNMAVRAEFNVSNGDKISSTGTKSEVSANSLMAGVQYRF